ncbi:metal ABC transporter substrate-binding protein [Hydrogenophilus thiooxidans]|uniref:metal ABC transporter substrate-binding protein n=1 Tax=Hydrogenophilus thiooxidans TaxID=2820326 RepID=UPI001C244592|nr:metal ABC transporter substrate-binding protein [Hydrogenophilus thiooxidans]
MNRWLVGIAIGLLATWAWALEVVATTESMAVLARTVGGDAVRVTVLAPADRDPHTLQVKPSMIRALRDADLLVAVGAELEVGWLPAALKGAANPKIVPGQLGYFEAAAQVNLLEVKPAADRALGDVHPMGNPHLHLDPVRMGEVAQALAVRLARLDPANGNAFSARAAALVQAIAEHLPAWQSRCAGSGGAVLYHKTGLYLLERFGVPLLGTLEPVPGVPPTGNHLETLATQLKERKGVVLYHPYEPREAAAWLAERLGWQAIAVPLEPPSGSDADGYFAVIDQWCSALAQAR